MIRRKDNFVNMPTGEVVFGVRLIILDLYKLERERKEKSIKKGKFEHQNEGVGEDDGDGRVSSIK